MWAAVALFTSACAVPAKMRAALVVNGPCDTPDWSCLTLGLIDTPTPGAGQALIRVEGSSVNPVNVDLVEPRCKTLPKPFGCTEGQFGSEAAGTVVQVGAGCGLKVGDEVWGGAMGAYAEYTLLPCNATGVRPVGLSAIDAGTVPVVGVTSLECLRAAGAPWTKKNLTVAITSGSGGTGFMGIQLAKALGAARVVTAATGAGIDMVKALGADLVIDYKQQEIFAALPDDSVDIVYDNIGFPGTADKAMHAIREGGVFLVLQGGNGGTISKHPKAGVRQVPFGLADLSTSEPLDALAELFVKGGWKAQTEHVYGLGEIRQAFNESKGGQVLGKLAISAAR